MKRWTLALALLAGLLLPATAQAGTLDQQQTTATTSAGIEAGSQSAAQTFTAGLTGKLDQIELLLLRYTGPSATPITVEIRDVSGGVPGSTVLATATLSEAAVPGTGTFTWLTVTFADPASVTAGTQYAIVLMGGAGYVAWGYTSGDPYASGAGFFTREYTGSAAWVALGGDYAFRTYVATTATAVTLRQLSANATRQGALVRWRTVSEVDTLGFNVYREVNGKRVRVNSKLIAGKGRGLYTFLDRRAPKGKTVRYWVQAVNLDGSRSWYGPARIART